MQLQFCLITGSSDKGLLTNETFSAAVYGVFNLNATALPTDNPVTVSSIVNGSYYNSTLSAPLPGTLAAPATLTTP